LYLFLTHSYYKRFFFCSCYVSGGILPVQHTFGDEANPTGLVW